MDKEQVASILDQIGILLELQGENPFRCQAYYKASRAILQLDRSLAEIVAAGELGQIAGIGETLKDKITALVLDGQLPFYEELRQKTPPGLLEMLRLPGVGPKKIKALHGELGIDTIDKLKLACSAGKVAELKGFGKKTEQKILEGIAFMGQMAARHRLDQAMALAEHIASQMRKCSGIIRMELCGSLRRRKETVADIDILISSDNPAPIMDAFVKLPEVVQIIGHGETKSSAVMAADFHGQRIVMNADLRVVNDAQFPFALNYFTGSKEHNVAMRQRAIQYGLKLNEYELAAQPGKGQDEGKSVPCKEEADLYRALDLDYVPPELRENTGEIDAAEKYALPSLIEPGDITGTFHCHTNWSDGVATLDEMVAAAKKLGFKYFGIGDHSQSLVVANGLSIERVREQQEKIDALNQRIKGIRVFKGSEVDILPDGRLDYPDEVLDTFDYVVASVHNVFNLSQEEMTKRIIRALSHPKVTMLGHATGRLLLRRDGYKVDLEAVLQTAAKHNKLIEINASPHRLDIDWIHCKRAKALGVQLVINPDAHSTTEIENTTFGVSVARRGWLEKKDVFNTQTAAQVARSLEQRKGSP